MISPFACNDYRLEPSSIGKRHMCVCGYPKDEHQLTKQQRSRESHTMNLLREKQPRIDAPSDRYVVEDGSHTAHCCFTHTVMDKQGGTGSTIAKETPVCECWSAEDAERICMALNLMERGW